MKKTVKKIMIPVLYGLLMISCFGGCTYHNPQGESTSQARVVTEVNIHYRNGPISCSRYYRDGEKMRRILNYLRLIDPYGRPEEDPERAEGSEFQIVLSYSDGQQKIYRQKANRFLIVEGDTWKKIDPERAEELAEILGQMDSDTPFSAP